ncbi:CBS domain-containing protein [Zhouia sp. PK063]|uniref:CBS domain-containing protein n=1 Tax=Zhouia sp. PK063 TaxID=3373602 RepID=UPI00378CEBB0
MNLRSYINNDVTPLLPVQKVKEAHEMFANLTQTHIPVVDNNYLMGSISEDDIQGYDANKKIEDYTYALDTFFVRTDTSWLDVLQAFATHNTDMMPVLNQYREYVGYYNLIDVVSLFEETPFFKEPGGILIIEKGNREYSFSQISQIVESNNGILLGAFISEIRENTTQITLKIGNVGLNAIIQTFRRYNYEIVSGNEDDAYLEDLKDRSNYFKKFLNI